MAQFQFRLATLLKLRRVVRDERRRHLAEALHADAILQERRAELEETLAQVRREYHLGQGPLDVDQILNTQRYEMVIRSESQLLAQQSATLESEIENRRQAAVAADRDLRVLEMLRDRQAERYRQAEARREMKRLDEIASRRTRREEDR